MSEAIGYIPSCYPPLIVIGRLALLAIMLWVFKAWLSGNLIARRAAKVVPQNDCKDGDKK